MHRHIHHFEVQRRWQVGEKKENKLGFLDFDINPRVIDVQDRLVDLLGYDALSLVSTLVMKRSIIVDTIMKMVRVDHTDKGQEKKLSKQLTYIV